MPVTILSIAVEFFIGILTRRLLVSGLIVIVSVALETVPGYFNGLLDAQVESREYRAEGALCDNSYEKSRNPLCELPTILLLLLLLYYYYYYYYLLYFKYYYYCYYYYYYCYCYYSIYTSSSTSIYHS